MSISVFWGVVKKEVGFQGAEGVEKPDMLGSRGKCRVSLALKRFRNPTNKLPEPNQQVLVGQFNTIVMQDNHAVPFQSQRRLPDNIFSSS